MVPASGPKKDAGVLGDEAISAHGRRTAHEAGFIFLFLVSVYKVPL